MHTLLRFTHHAAALAVAATVVACGGSDDAMGPGRTAGGAAGSAGAMTGGSGGDVGAAGAGGLSGGAGAAGAAGTDGSAGTGAGGSAGAAGTGADGGVGGQAGAAGAGGQPDGGTSLSDPAVPGPYSVVWMDASVPAAAVGSTVATTCFHPDNDDGPYPLVTLAPGFQLPPSQYHVSAGHLASFGFVVCVAGYNASLFSPNHLDNAKEVLAVVDWALDPSGPLASHADPNWVGAAGHSLGGRLSVLAASLDDRIDAVFGMDPVDADSPDASDLLPLPIPTGFLGELLDAQGGFQPCAPAADNFETFYAQASGPSFKVELSGANHMSFLDDPSSCGLICSFCQSPTLEHEKAIALTRSYLAAFFLRHLAGEAGYDTYLTGVIAQERYVQTGVARIESK